MSILVVLIALSSLWVLLILRYFWSVLNYSFIFTDVLIITYHNYVNLKQYGMLLLSMCIGFIVYILIHILGQLLV